MVALTAPKPLGPCLKTKQHLTNTITTTAEPNKGCLCCAGSSSPVARGFGARAPMAIPGTRRHGTQREGGPAAVPYCQGIGAMGPFGYISFLDSNC